MLDQTTPTESQSSDGTNAIIPTFGQQLVGSNFNPSGDDKVAKVKRLCAELADILHENLKQKKQTEISYMVYGNAMANILDASMNATKYLIIATKDLPS